MAAEDKTNAWQVLSLIELDLGVWVNGGGLQLTCKAELILKPPGGERHLLQAPPVQELDVGTGHTALVIILSRGTTATLTRKGCFI